MPADPSEKLGGTWTYDNFKAELVRAESHLPPSELSLPTTIETGAIGQELVRLETATLADPYKREREQQF